MKLTAPHFTKRLGAELAQLMAADFQYRAAALEFQRSANDGVDVISLSSNSKWSPHISIAFYFGRGFHAAAVHTASHRKKRLSCLILQYSLNAGAMQGLYHRGRSQWDVDITAPPRGLAEDIHTGMREIAEPFFVRFAGMRAARDAIAGNDTWCFGGQPFWRQLLELDVALGDIDHFREWSRRLAEPQRLEALEQLDALQRLTPSHGDGHPDHR